MFNVTVEVVSDSALLEFRFLFLSYITQMVLFGKYR
jgi:hypothetical protein